MLTDLAVAMAGGATTITQIGALRDQGDLFGIAWDTTAWRTLAGCESAVLARIAKARAMVRRHVWSLIEAKHGRIPPARAAGRDLGEVAVIRLEATIVVARSDKQQARARLRDVRASSADGLVR